MSGIVLALAGATYSNLPAIGSALGGGYFAGQISTAGNGVADYNLVVGPNATASSNLDYKTTNTGGDPTSVINGPANSAAMNDASHPAAQFCEGLTVGGFTDWYLPAINELEVCYYNLKPTTDSNNSSWGINANAVPARASNYSGAGPPAVSPAQTSATIFQTGNAEAYPATGIVRSSSQYIPSGNYALTIQFAIGTQAGSAKVGGSPKGFVRAVRRIAV
jgi:hypothetical protein